MIHLFSEKKVRKDILLFNEKQNMLINIANKL